MKVLAALVLFVASASALRSGPYLASGWKPEGPAFYLPSEVQKPAAPRDIVLEESEGASSDFLREYGPPKVEVSQDIKTQSLPEVTTDQPFIVLEAKFGQDEAITVEAITEVVAELKTEVSEENTAVESKTDEKATTEAAQEDIKGKSLNLEVEASEAENNEVENEEAAAVGVNEEASVSAKIESEVEEEVKIIEQGVKNIAETIVNLEKEVVAEQVQISQDVKELKSVVQNSGSVEVPEGFLEYGLPGFRQYGPPNLDSLQRSEVEEKSPVEETASNETRRRRFSPKFRSSQH